MSEYSEKLKDPRWQRKRLEIMQRDEFACNSCGDTDSTLNVHHKTYRKGADPWDYDDENFSTLCQSCHKSIHADLYQIKMRCGCAEMSHQLKTIAENWGLLEMSTMNLVAMFMNGHALTQSQGYETVRIKIVKEFHARLSAAIRSHDENVKKEK